MDFLGIDWVGLTTANIRRLLLSGIFVVVVLVTSIVLRKLLGWAIGQGSRGRIVSSFWARQIVSLLAAVILIIGLLSIWFTDPGRLATALGLFSAGLAFALQQPVTSFASYFIILGGGAFTVGDRISMGGVRGDVIRLGFIQTTIMEMGQPPAVQGGDPAMWVQSRQFTGRMVTVTNAKIFSDPVFNYTRDFPFLWEEMAVPITYLADRARAEAILLGAAAANAVPPAEVAAAGAALQRRFGVDPIDIEPRVYFRITDNWLELTVRFLVPTHQIRAVKDRIARAILADFDAAGIGIASSTYDIVGFPPVTMRPATAAPPG